jgi:hypothetical protein
MSGLAGALIGFAVGYGAHQIVSRYGKPLGWSSERVLRVSIMWAVPVSVAANLLRLALSRAFQ